MATLNPSGAVSTVASPTFVMSAGLVVVGTVASALLTDWLRDNVTDIQLMGGDVLYSAVRLIATLMLMRGTTGRMLSIGMVAGGIGSEAREAGVF